MNYIAFQMMTLEQINALCKGTMMEHLSIEFVDISETTILAKMPVDHRTIQPFGRLHGGAIMALAESVGSGGSVALVNNEDVMVLGTEISGSHVSNTSEEFVFGRGTLVHKGKTQHVWEIRIEDKNGKILSICRLTNRIIPRNH